MESGYRPKIYVVAVSGGVDSVVLLDILVQRGDARLIVAHFDHGIRKDSQRDRLFVQDLADRHGLQFMYEEGFLGPNVSEAAARAARYAFLRRVMAAVGARAIVTAHHEDDVLETAILNLLRGTGRKGLSSLRSTNEIYRPLLSTPKAHIITYARTHGLEWHEDSTNTDQAYLRNYIRQRLLPRFDAAARTQLRELIARASVTNAELDDLLAQELDLQPAREGLDRQWFISLPHAVAREVVAMWLRAAGVTNFDRKTIERIVVLGKTLTAGKQIDIDGAHIIAIRPKVLALLVRDR